MSSEINRLSSGLMLGTTLNHYNPRNDNIIAQVAYALTSIVGSEETVKTLAFSALSLSSYSFSFNSLTSKTKWLSSSSLRFSKVTDKKNTLRLFQSCNFMSSLRYIPRSVFTKWQ